MVAPPSPPWSVLVQLLGEHHQDAAGATDIGELVDVSIGGHAAQRMAAVPRCDLEGLVDVVYREGDAVHADLVGPCRLGLDRVGVDVLEELEATVPVRRLEHGNFRMVAVEADGRVRPLAADRVPAQDGQPEVGEEGDRRFEVTNGDADVLELDRHAWHVTQPLQSCASTSAAASGLRAAVNSSTSAASRIKYGATARSSVSASMRCLVSRPAGVKPPSSATSPRAFIVSTRADSCGTDRWWIRPNFSAGIPRSRATRTWASRPPMPSAISAEICPSPRCSRSRDAAWNSRATGSS